MEAHQKKTTMSVAEMRKMLGLKKTESYWLIHKNQFETITVCGKMRIVLDSFENWYANQVHYKKINGEAPGKEIRKTSLSIRDLSELRPRGRRRDPWQPRPGRRGHRRGPAADPRAAEQP